MVENIVSQLLNVRVPHTDASARNKHYLSVHTLAGEQRPTRGNWNITPHPVVRVEGKLAPVSDSYIIMNYFRTTPVSLWRSDLGPMGVSDHCYTRSNDLLAIGSDGEYGLKAQGGGGLLHPLLEGLNSVIWGNCYLHVKLGFLPLPSLHLMFSMLQNNPFPPRTNTIHKKTRIPKYPYFRKI